MKPIFLIFILFGCTQSYSQRIDMTSEVSLLNLSKRMDGPASVEGSQYFDEKFAAAKIALTPDKVYSVRYNAFTGDMEVDGGPNNIYVLDKNMDNLDIVLTKSNTIYKAYDFINKDDSKQRGFFIVLNDLDSPIKLLKRQTIELIDRKEAKSGYQQSVPAHFKKMDETYYIKINDQIATAFSTNKKDVAALFPSHEDDILKYIKSNKISLKDENDLIKLINYSNQLK